jgi:sugar phosphate isomerase/epimerase
MNNPSNSYPVLKSSYKGKYPFRLGTTSFIYRDHYVPNVELLGPFIDEVELLLFESDQVESLLSKSVIADLVRLSRELDLSYNIHLPTDVSITDPAAAGQQHAVDTLVRIIELTAPLSPTGCALHLPFNGNVSNPASIGRWQEIVHRNLEKMLAAGVPGGLLAIETLDYPPEIIRDILSECNVSMCLDVGHLIVHGYGVQSIFDKYAGKIAMIHLHGVDGRRDHLALERLPEKLSTPVFEILRRFSGSVSLEVFSFDDLERSLNCLEQRWQRSGFGFL